MPLRKSKNTANMTRTMSIGREHTKAAPTAPRFENLYDSGSGGGVYGDCRAIEWTARIVRQITAAGTADSHGATLR